jgi:stage V sporulation protein D (sporulation-specific penicillin-binding protein)
MKTCRTRALIVCFGLGVLFTVFSWRLIHIQVIQHDYYAARADAKHIVKKPVYGQRGQIVDANYEMLAENVSVQTVYADASHILGSEPTKSEKTLAKLTTIAQIVAKHLGISEDEIKAKILTERRFIVLKKEVDQITVSALQADLAKNSLKGVYFIEDFKRVYPNGSMLCHVLGYLDHEHNGISGLEKSMDNYLQPSPRWLYSADNDQFRHSIYHRIRAKISLRKI